MKLNRTEFNLLVALTCVEGGALPHWWLKPYVRRKVKGLKARRLLRKRRHFAAITEAGRSAVKGAKP